VVTRSTDNDEARRDGHERRITHFIPPVALRGSPAEKLVMLDRLIHHLEKLRQTCLVMRTTEGHPGHPHLRAARQPWPWWAAGIALVGLFFLFGGIARSCGVMASL
jgi:hypothetical protein